MSAIAGFLMNFYIFDLVEAQFFYRKTIPLSVRTRLVFQVRLAAGLVGVISRVVNPRYSPEEQELLRRTRERTGEVGGLGRILPSLEHVWKSTPLRGEREKKSERVQK